MQSVEKFIFRLRHGKNVSPNNIFVDSYIYDFENTVVNKPESADEMVNTPDDVGYLEGLLLLMYSNINILQLMVNQQHLSDKDGNDLFLTPSSFYKKHIKR